MTTLLQYGVRYFEKSWSIMRMRSTRVYDEVRIGKDGWGGHVIFFLRRRREGWSASSQWHVMIASNSAWLLKFSVGMEDESWGSEWWHCYWTLMGQRSIVISSSEYKYLISQGEITVHLSCETLISDVIWSIVLQIWCLQDRNEFASFGSSSTGSIRYQREMRHDVSFDLVLVSDGCHTTLG